MSKRPTTPRRNPYKLSRNAIVEPAWDIDWEGNHPTEIHDDVSAYARWISAMACISPRLPEPKS